MDIKSEKKKCYSRISAFAPGVHHSDIAAALHADLEHAGLVVVVDGEQDLAGDGHGAVGDVSRVTVVAR